MDRYSKEISPLFQGLIKFNRYKTIVEIGVFRGYSTRYLCEAAQVTGGIVYGFDFWGVEKFTKQKGYSQEAVSSYLKKCKIKNFKLIQIDTKMEAFKQIIKEKCPVIDFAFIDGWHSYEGIKNDFDVVYPLLAETGMIAFHDTLKVDGCREFIMDLRTIYYDGAFDIIDLPWGNGERRVGVSILMKRTYPVIDHEIDEICGSLSTPDEIYLKEKDWYKRECGYKEKLWI